MNFLDKTSDALLRLDKFTAFLTVGDSKSVNPMTIGWASFGIACGKPVLSVMIRQSRFSKQLIDSNPVFTVSIPRDVRMDTSVSSKRTTSSTPVTVRWLRSSSVTACGRRCGAAFLSSYGIGSPPGSGLLPAYAGRAGDMRRDGRGTGTGDASPV